MIACRDCAVSRAHSFCSLDAATRAVIDEIKAGVSYERGDTVFVEGTPARSVYIVCSGSLKLLNGSSQGKVLLTRFAMPGEMLGLPEAWAGERYDCSAVAAEASVVSVIPAQMLQRFVRSYPAAAMRMTEALAEQYRNVNREARFLAFGGTSIERLARLLLEASRPDDDDPEFPCIHIPPHATHVELAESIGSTRETVTRVLSELSRRGLVRRSRSGLTIVDREHLAALLDMHATVTHERDPHAPAAAARDLLMETESWRAS
jgi:CRP/FNR family transcriptional regulator